MTIISGRDGLSLSITKYWNIIKSENLIDKRQKRNYDLKVNRKQRRLALNFALNAHANNGSLFAVDSVSVESGKTKDALSLLNKLNRRDVLIVVDNLDEKTYLAFRNIKNCYVIEKNEINAYLVAAFHSVVVEKAVLESLTREV